MSHSSALARLESDLRMANRAKGTIQQYLASIRRFQEMTGKTADQTSLEEIRRWVEHLQGQPIGPERLRCHYSALAFLFRKTLGQPEKVAFISMPRKDAPLSVILTKGELDRVLKSFLVAKYSVFFALIYAAGYPPPESHNASLALLLAHGLVKGRDGRPGWLTGLYFPRRHQRVRPCDPPG